MYHHFGFLLVLLHFGAVWGDTEPLNWDDAISIFEASVDTASDVRNYSNIPPYALPNEMKNWAALGDSFSAAPGCGCRVPGTTRTCQVNDLGYPVFLNNTQLFQDPASYNAPPFFLGSCTGDLIENVPAKMSFQKINSDTGITTLSIGGNNIEFGKILRSCILRKDMTRCDNQLARSRSILYSYQLFQNYGKLMKIILAWTSWQTRTPNDSNPPRRTFLYVTGYPAFFDSWTEQCNEVRFRLIPGFEGMPLSQDLRRKFNQLNQELNYVLAYWLDLVNQVAELAPGKKTDYGIDFAKWVDQDRRYNSHRFCRQDVTEPSRNLASTWFFNFRSRDETGRPEGCDDNASGDDGDELLDAEEIVQSGWLNDTDPGTCMDEQTVDSGDLLSFIKCQMAIAQADGTLEDAGEFFEASSSDLHDAETLIPQSVSKSFHPRSGGHIATKNEILQRLNYRWISQGGPPEKGQILRIMCIGDYNTIGYGPEYRSYRQGLYFALTQDNLDSVMFVGSQGSRTRPSDYSNHEAYDGSIAQIRDAIDPDDFQFYAPNVVIIMAGSRDILGMGDDDDVGLATAINELQTLLYVALARCADCAILVAELPPLGATPKTGQWAGAWPPTPKQLQVIKFNAMLANMINKLKTEIPERRLYKVHTTATLFQEDEVNQLRASGFQRIALDFAEAIYDAAVDNNIGGRQDIGIAATAAATTTSSAPSPPPTSKMLIAYDVKDDDASYRFYAKPYTATTYDICSPKTEASVPANADPTNAAEAPFPVGTFDVGTLGGDEQIYNCTYEGEASGPGNLTCVEGTVSGFTCTDISDKPHGVEYLDCEDGHNFAWKVQCEW